MMLWPSSLHGNDVTCSKHLTLQVRSVDFVYITVGNDSHDSGHSEHRELMYPTSPDLSQ